jgi:type IV pilus assembly protein PilM
MLQLPSIKTPTIKLPSIGLGLPRRSSASDVVGLDIQPGLVAAVKVRVNGSIRAERAAAQPLDADTVREGEVVDPEALTEALRELFSAGTLGKRVRVGIANQRTVMRTLELPPVTDRKELAAAVRFQAQDQVPMPLSNAVLDFHPLGIFDSPAGPRQRVVLVAAQRDMVERLLAAVRAAGLTPQGVDLSAFALIRSLYDRSDGDAGRVLYVNVDGLTNLAIAEGTTCRFTRVVGGGVEAMAAELAVRRGVALSDARALLSTIDLSAPLAPEAAAVLAPDERSAAQSLGARAELHGEPEPAAAPEQESGQAVAEPVLSREDYEAQEASMGYSEAIEAAQAPVSDAEPEPSAPDADAEVREVLENGVRAIAGEIRNSLDFHRTQDEGGEVAYVALSGAALDLPGFAGALEATLGMEVRSEAVGLVDAELDGKVSTHRLSIAAGLATTEVAQ